MKKLFAVYSPLSATDNGEVAQLGERRVRNAENYMAGSQVNKGFQDYVGKFLSKIIILIHKTL